MDAAAGAAADESPAGAAVEAASVGAAEAGVSFSAGYKSPYRSSYSLSALQTASDHTMRRSQPRVSFRRMRATLRRRHRVNGLAARGARYRAASHGAYAVLERCPASRTEGRRPTTLSRPHLQLCSGSRCCTMPTEILPDRRSSTDPAPLRERVTFSGSGHVESATCHRVWKSHLVPPRQQLARNQLRATLSSF